MTVDRIPGILQKIAPVTRQVAGTPGFGSLTAGRQIEVTSPIKPALGQSPSGHASPRDIIGLNGATRDLGYA